MADEKDKQGKTPGKLDRRDLLKGLSTVPALGLFGYAWHTQRAYQQAAAEAQVAPTQAADVQTVNVALLGAGAQGQVLTDSMLRIPGLRFRAVCDIWARPKLKTGTFIWHDAGNAGQVAPPPPPGARDPGRRSP